MLLVDEPTSSLDPKISREVMGLIREIAREFHIPVLCNIHDVELATEFCTHVIGLQDGVKKFEGRPGRTGCAGAARDTRDGGPVNGPAVDVRAAAIAAGRRRGRALRSLTYLAIFGAVLWSIQVIMIADTDWTRLAASSAGKEASRSIFLEFDYRLLPELVDPTIDTALMATLATLAGLLLAIPVAWLGAANISPARP